MGQDVTIPGVTEEELLRAAAIDRVLDHVTITPRLAAREFTCTDFRDRVRQQDRDISESTARRELDQLIAAGLVESGKRHDERVDRVVVAYWFVEEE